VAVFDPFGYPMPYGPVRMASKERVEAVKMRSAATENRRNVMASGDVTGVALGGVA
jgi:hypothetical protein